MRRWIELLVPAALAFLAFFPFFSTAAWCEDAPLIQSAYEGHIDGLSWQSKDVQADTDSWNNSGIAVTLQGIFEKQGWSLLRLEHGALQPVEKSSEGAFKLRVPIQAKKTEIDFRAVGPRGQMEREVIRLEFPEWERFNAVKELLPWRLGVQSVYLSYTQNGTPSFSQVLAGPRVAFEPVFSGGWDLRADAFAEILPLLTSRSGSGLTVFGYNVLGGYSVAAPSSSWRYGIQAGTFFRTTSSAGNFGFKNLYGPKLGINLDRKLDLGSSIRSSIRFSPFMNGGTLMALSNHELAFGAEWSRALANGRILNLGAEYSTLSFSYLSTVISSSALRLNATLGL